MQSRALSLPGPGGQITPLTCTIPPRMLWWGGHRHPPPHATAQGHKSRMLEQRHTSGQEEEAQSPLEQDHPTILFATGEPFPPSLRLTQTGHPQTWLEMLLCLLGTGLSHSLGGLTMALGRSQAEMRVQTLSKALGAKAEIPPGRGPEGRQRCPHQGLCPRFPLPLEAVAEPGHFSVSSLLCTKQPHHQGNKPHQGSSSPAASAAPSPLPRSPGRGTERYICPRQPGTSDR